MLSYYQNISVAKRLLTGFIISSLLTVGLFGIFGISMSDNNGRHACPISVLSSDDCALSSSPLSETFHHISALQNFAQGVINTNAFSLMLLVLLMFAFVIFSTFPRKTPVPQASFSRSYRRIKESDCPQKKQFLRWLALHYKRDPHASQWVHYEYS